MRRTAAVLASVAVLGAACSSDEPTGRFEAAPSTSAPPAAADCPASYVEPDPNRPATRLTFELSDDLETVTGTEQVTFVPDLPVRELVFRLTANSPASVDEGSSIEITSARADPAGGAHRVERAGAPGSTQGGLLVLPLGREVRPGQRVTAEIGFRLRLGSEAFDRFGHVDSFAWWGSGHPLLAWERGVGWHTEPLLRFAGESATSEAARIDLTVTAPAEHTVLASGMPDAPVAVPGGRRRWHTVADRARDVSVAVGPFRLKEARVGGTRIVVGAPQNAQADALLAEHARAVRDLARHFGPFPFPVLSVARLPVGGGGIEYPGSILMLDDSRLVAVHETAHQWFYGMVGDAQARDPWLDEAFATYAEELVDGSLGTGSSVLRTGGRVGAPMQAFGEDSDEYFATVYAKGAAALAAARKAAGADRFDAALRCYVNRNAWRIARPADLAAALADLPAAIETLRAAGALP